MQLVFELLPNSVENVPAVQFVQFDVEFPPAVARYVPAGQARHDD